MVQLRLKVRIWTKIGNSNYCKVVQNRIWTRDHKFRRKIQWAKIGFSKLVHHVRINSFKYFSGTKKRPPRSRKKSPTSPKPLNHVSVRNWFTAKKGQTLNYFGYVKLVFWDWSFLLIFGHDFCVIFDPFYLCDVFCVSLNSIYDYTIFRRYRRCTCSPFQNF